jgi:predicted porin
MPKERNVALKLTGCALGLMFAGVVHAQSSVTLFGVIDLGMLYTNKTANAAGRNVGKQFSMIDAGSSYSQFGLIGTEDLGGNLKAKFKLESGISAANGGLAHCNGNMFGCEAWVALDGNFGEVKTGLQFSPFLYTVFALDPRDMSFFGSEAVNYISNFLGTGINVSNSVSYTSPSLAGLQAMVMFAFGDQAGDFQAGRQYSASLKYERGGLLIDGAIYDGNSGGTSPEPTNLSVEGRTLGVAYKFGALTAKASFVNYKVAGSFDNNVYGGGLDYFVLPTLDVNGGVSVTSDRDDTANHSLLVALGATYFLSKRTRLYGQLGVVNNHGAMNTGLSISGALYGVQGTTVGGVLGIQHSF